MAVHTEDAGLVPGSMTLAALVEAKTMSESIRTLVQNILDETPQEGASMLEAIIACTLRLDSAVDPVIERAELT
ncbi:MAG TPA: hypothetical protein VF453_09435 [Burkholderiaceae bacterium]